MSASVGQKLRQARQAKELSLEKAARDTFIRLPFLQALEAGQLDLLPSKAQARGFVRSYAVYLGLDPAPLLVALEKGEPPAEDAASPTQASLPRPASAGQTTEAIFREIGQVLRSQRELLGFVLTDVEQQTHIRLHYLKALESGSLENMPSLVQARGMLSNYALFLGLDADALLLRYAEALQIDLETRRGPRRVTPEAQPKTRAASGLRRLLSADLVFGVTGVVVVLAFVIWGAIQVSSLSNIQANGGNILGTESPATPTVTATPVPLASAPASNGQPEATPTPLGGGSVIIVPTASVGQVQVYIVARQRAWMRVVVDGQTQFEGRTVPGSAYSFSGRSTVELLTGNAAGLQVFYNQRDLGSLGFLGEVVSRTFTLDGVIVPTPLPTATSLTPTPTPTVTPDPRITPPPTDTGN